MRWIRAAHAPLGAAQTWGETAVEVRGPQLRDLELAALHSLQRSHNVDWVHHDAGEHTIDKRQQQGAAFMLRLRFSLLQFEIRKAKQSM